MSFDWIDFLELAIKLQASPDLLGSEEASYRTAVSRAYYAAFHLALAFATSKGYAPSHSGNDHRGVPAYFRSGGGASGRLRMRIAMNLDRIRDGRRRADYIQNLGEASPEALARQTIHFAKHIVTDLQDLSM